MSSSDNFKENGVGGGYTYKYEYFMFAYDESYLL